MKSYQHESTVHRSVNKVLSSREQLFFFLQKSMGANMHSNFAIFYLKTG